MGIGSLFKNQGAKTKGGGERENTKVLVGRVVFFTVIFSLLAITLIDTAFIV